jgi:predicted DNA-binding transcriptional regulator AlpA
MMQTQLPEDGFVRLKQIIGDRKTGIPPIFPVSASTWWQGVQCGRFPKPVKLSPAVTAWRARDVRALIEKVGGAK